jgi:hypothetical protein
MRKCNHSLTIHKRTRIYVHLLTGIIHFDYFFNIKFYFYPLSILTILQPFSSKNFIFGSSLNQKKIHVHSIA